MVLIGWAPWNGRMALKGIMGNGGGGMPIAGLKNPGLRKGIGGAELPFSGMFEGFQYGPLNAPKLGGRGPGGN